ncbi:MAG: apolipoprotein N-acyltransferase [Planctomycetota bacterium]
MNGVAADPNRPPGNWRRLGLGYAHPGAGLPWMLLGLGLGLDLLALPPGPLPLAILVADVPFLLLLGRASRGRWKRWVFLYGFLHFAVALRWLSEIHPAQVVGAALVLSVAYLLAGLAIRLLGRRRVPFLLLVPAVLVLEEVFRTVWFGGMPWPTRSLSFAVFPGASTWVASSVFLGAYALSFLAALSSAWVVTLLPGTPAGAPAWAGHRRPAVLGALAVLVVAGLLFAGGTWRIHAYEAGRADGRVVTTETGPGVLVAVQGDIPQSLKHASDPGLLMRMFRRHLGLSREALVTERRVGQPVFAVLWPETMIPWSFVGPRLALRFPDEWENEIRVVQNVADVSRDLDEPPRYLLGAIHLFRRGDERHARADRYGTHDSLFLVDPRAVPSPSEPPPPPADPPARPPWILGRHDKRVLVPGGEYTPFADVLPLLRWFRTLVSPIPELDPGRPDMEPLLLAQVPGRDGRMQDVRAGTVICFELLFPAACRAWRARGAQVLLNPANYGWFGPTGFRSQIRAQAALRAAETATTVVMAGNTGPTLFWDPVGRPYGTFRDERGTRIEPVTGDETTFRPGWAVAPLVADSLTPPYVRWGDGPWLGLGVLLLLAGLLAGRRRLPPAADGGASGGRERGQVKTFDSPEGSCHNP